MMKNLISKKTVTAMVAGVMLSFSFASQASDDFVESVTVKYASVDTTNSQGQDQLYQKLEQAAAQVCGSTNIEEAGSAMRVTQNKLCAKRALSRAVKRVGIEEVSEIHLSQR